MRLATAGYNQTVAGLGAVEPEGPWEPGLLGSQALEIPMRDVTQRTRDSPEASKHQALPAPPASPAQGAP